MATSVKSKPGIARGAVPWQSDEFEVPERTNSYRTTYNFTAAALFGLLGFVVLGRVANSTDMASESKVVSDSAASSITAWSIVVIPSRLLYWLGMFLGFVLLLFSALGFYKFIAPAFPSRAPRTSSAAPVASKLDTAKASGLRKRPTTHRRHSPGAGSPSTRGAGPTRVGGSPSHGPYPSSHFASPGYGRSPPPMALSGTPFLVTPQRRRPPGASPQRQRALDNTRDNTMMDDRDLLLQRQDSRPGFGRSVSGMSVASGHSMAGSAMTSPSLMGMYGGYPDRTRSEPYGSPYNPPRSRASPSSYWSKSNFPTYTPAMKDVPAKTALSSKFPVDDPRSDEALAEEYEKLIMNFKIGDRKDISVKIDDMANEMRYWLGNEVLRTYARELEESEAWFETIANQYKKEKGDMAMGVEAQQILSGSDTSKRAQFLISQNYPPADHPEAKKRQRVQKVIDVPAGYGIQASSSSESTKKYAIKRISQLAERGSLMSGFIWDGGGVEWKSTLPTDAQLVMHCLCCYMDEILGSFTSMYFRDMAVDKAAITQVALLQTRKQPNAPYFMVRTRKKEDNKGQPEYEDWKIKPGRNNLFLALSMFLLYVDKQLRGQLGYMGLQDPALNGLSDVLRA